MQYRVFLLLLFFPLVAVVVCGLAPKLHSRHAMSAFHLRLSAPRPPLPTPRQSPVEHKTLEFISQQPFATFLCVRVCVCKFSSCLLFFCFSWHKKMQFSWHFCRKLAASVSVCKCVFVFARRLFELQYARGQQVILWAGHLLYTLPPPAPIPLPLTCLLHLFPLLYLFGIFFSLVSACLVLFFFFFGFVVAAPCGFLIYLVPLHKRPTYCHYLAPCCCCCCHRK